MADPVVLYGPTFGEEVIDAGLGGLSFSWTPYVINERQNLNVSQNTTLDGVIAAHDPAKQRKGVLSVDEFIGRWTNAEYLNLLKKRRDDIAANKVGNAKNWDQVCSGEIVDLNKKKVQTLKQDLVTDGVLTQARADEIFS